MAARIFFSGLGEEANYLTRYPGHRPNAPKALWGNALKIVGGALRAQYLDDLIVRHTPATKSQWARQTGVAISHANQLDTICLRRNPMRPGPQGNRYKAPPLRAGKSVLIVDDICTQGFSLEAARAFIQKTGSSVICLASLKTPGGNDYEMIHELDPEIANPYSPFKTGTVRTRTFGYNYGIRNANAPDEVAAAFDRYRNWDWTI